LALFATVLEILTLKARKSRNFPPFFLWASAGEPLRILLWNLASEN